MLLDSTKRKVDTTIFDSSYEILEQVGRGRNSIVYKARKLGDERADDPDYGIVALKVLLHNPKHPEVNIKRAKREAISMLSCVHKNIVKLNDYVAREDLCYLSMEYAPQGDLRVLLERNPEAFAPPLVFRMMQQVLHGLEAIHRTGIIHRDIKPENILLGGDFVAKIADFGVAFVPSERPTLSDASKGVGTFDYLAPESLAEGITNESTDVYSVVATAYQLITGYLPFEGNSFSEQIAAKMSGRPRALPEKVAAEFPTIIKFFERGLASDPKARFKSAIELRLGIQALLDAGWIPEALTVSPQLREDEHGNQIIEPAPRLGERQPVVRKGSQGAIRKLIRSGYQGAEGRFNTATTGRSPGMLKRFLLSPQGAVSLLVPIVMFWIAVHGNTSGGEGATASIVPGLEEGQEFPEQESRDAEYAGLPQGANTISEGLHQAKPSPFALPEEGLRQGILKGVFADFDMIPIYIAGAGSAEVVISLGLPGFTPLTISREDLLAGQELVFSGSGMILSLTAIPQDSMQNPSSGQAVLHGSFEEVVSGRHGSWEIW